MRKIAFMILISFVAGGCASVPDTYHTWRRERDYPQAAIKAGNGAYEVAMRSGKGSVLAGNLARSSAKAVMNRAKSRRADSLAAQQAAAGTR